MSGTEAVADRRDACEPVAALVAKAVLAYAANLSLSKPPRQPR